VNFVHIHLAINHSPLYATLFAFFFLLIGMIIRNRSVATSGLVIAIIAALLALATYFTGDQAADIIKESPPIAGVDKSMIREHELAAGFVLASTGVAALLAIVALFLGRNSPARPRWIEVVVLLVILWSITVIARTALLGGRIHHPEVRSLVTG
jgi:hypothetical protein